MFRILRFVKLSDDLGEGGLLVVDRLLHNLFNEGFEVVLAFHLSYQYINEQSQYKIYN